MSNIEKAYRQDDFYDLISNTDKIDLIVNEYLTKIKYTKWKKCMLQ